MHTAHVISYLDTNEKNFREHLNLTSRVNDTFLQLETSLNIYFRRPNWIKFCLIKTEQELRHIGRAERIIK